ncbi:MAG: membrane-bound lytic murein transglycosylase MltF [Xanthomonadales bacterium]|uniref:membrane-bound lytic murein transglycosylase MltF n=1 Tax=Hydrogenophaga sp. TaxID=1904254 RepID=UPI001692550F|nr:membrane-bound lytic murein transglycosylase MltF [Hydrogenophaga sp.]NIM70563.1 membrane-bound lytic murein transglycosylase MltF [Xanthomonadales bacterium]NIN32885.1 membrane-bound lytic murein transglycosylase MltF [Hydrogenophaga sp.]NIN59938.1 membrane-bound lytic murein transglycosylase MltF [Xanthomonadales bacterium]NIN75312.1 membrane-bound lytic murein transglycosylase MltF [Xanthomonadales bacterium]NIO12518.1 membrane-bound lytic murein transglycosylase MltF [Xanthomonadales ba
MELHQPHKLSVRLRALIAAALVLPFLTSGDDRPTRLEQAQQRGSLTLLTRNGASSYFLGADGDTGPEYDLVREFAEYAGLSVEVRVADNFAQLSRWLDRGHGELIAANLTRTPEREQQFRFGPDYDETRIEVVYRRGTKRPGSLADLSDRRLAVIAGSSYEELLRQAAVPGLAWEARADAGIEDLLLEISEGRLDATLVDSNILRANQRFYPMLGRAFTLPARQPQAWAFRRDDDDSLVQLAHRFLNQARESGTVAAIRAQYQARADRLDRVGMAQFQKQVRERLPEFLPVFREVAMVYNMDWRLLAAIGYQESHWDPDAASRTGVRGLMMLTRRTARQLGLDDRLDPEQSIDGGARYFLRLHQRIPERIAEPDRTWMALAAYNMGWGHLEDARIITQQQGADPDRWSEVDQRLPLLSQEKWHRSTRFGYARGFEAQSYVSNIRNYYDILVWMDTREHPLLVAAAGSGSGPVSAP